jgi:hypothetical protein
MIQIPLAHFSYHFTGGLKQFEENNRRKSFSTLPKKSNSNSIKENNVSPSQHNPTIDTQ